MPGGQWTSNQCSGQENEQIRSIKNILVQPYCHNVKKCKNIVEPYLTIHNGTQIDIIGLSGILCRDEQRVIVASSNHLIIEDQNMKINLVMENVNHKPGKQQEENEEYIKPDNIKR